MSSFNSPLEILYFSPFPGQTPAGEDPLGALFWDPVILGAYLFPWLHLSYRRSGQILLLVMIQLLVVSMLGRWSISALTKHSCAGWVDMSQYSSVAPFHSLYPQRPWSRVWGLSMEISSNSILSPSSASSTLYKILNQLSCIWSYLVINYVIAIWCHQGTNI